MKPKNFIKSPQFEFKHSTKTVIREKIMEVGEFLYEAIGQELLKGHVFLICASPS